MLLPSLPQQSRHTPWPTQEWLTGALHDVDRAAFDALVAEAFAAKATPTLGETHALLIVQGGRITFERYGEGFGAQSTHHSWSKAKSITQALIGLLVRDGKLDIRAPADVPEWARDERGEITLDQLLRMSSGLKFIEDYVPDGRPSDVIAMLFQEGKDDVAAYAAAQPLEHKPGSHWSYASGTSNIISRIASRALGAYGPAFERFMQARLFEPIGIRSAKPRFDKAGVFIGSSFCFMTARDFARFGLLYLRDGMWDGRRVLPEGWVDYARTPTYQQPGVDNNRYGAHWWLDFGGRGSFSANGYDGQFTIIAPDRDLIIVRHGVTAQLLKENLKSWIGKLAGVFCVSANDPRGAEALVGLLQPLLKAFEMLFLIARHFHPPRFEKLMAQIGTPDEDLRAARASSGEALADLGDVKRALDAAGDAALQAYAGLRTALEGSADMRSVYRSFRFVSAGLEALYPLTSVLPPVSRFFLDPSLRSDAALQAALAAGSAQDQAGVMQFAADDAEGDGERGGFWLYVPENYSPDRAWPLVMALHGGSGNGRQFLWSWLRDARSRGAILAAPTSVDGTWALAGDDVDTPNLMGILDFVRSSWNVDPERLLLTGMSDGGTFTYVSGLEAASPFTHLAPVSAAFHPLLAAMIDGERARGLPVHIVHGTLDWMFPASMAREAERMLSAAGANVTYREIEDLSHTYPREMNAVLLGWLSGPRAA